MLSSKKVIFILNKYNNNLTKSALELNISVATLRRYLVKNLIVYKNSNLKYNISYFKSLAKEKGGECLSLNYNYKTPLAWKCSKGHFWNSLGYNIINGSWCKKCYNNSKALYVNHNFFKYDNEKSFYYAGFIAADGSVFKNRLAINLALKELPFLQKMKSDLNSEHKIGHYINNGFKSCSLSFTSEQIIKDLKRFDIKPRKTWSLKFPEWLKKHPLVNHYMRGFIDGDGCFYIRKGKGNIAFNLVGTKSFLQSFQEVLFKKAFYNNTKVKVKTFNKNKSYYTLSYEGNNCISNMYDFLYKDSTIYFDRKEKIAKLAKKLKKEITKEKLIKLAKIFKNTRAIADHLGYNRDSISKIIKKLNIRDEFDIACGKIIINNEEVYNRFLEVKNASEVAREFNISLNQMYYLLKKINNDKQG